MWRSSDGYVSPGRQRAQDQGQLPSKTRKAKLTRCGVLTFCYPCGRRSHISKRAGTPRASSALDTQVQRACSTSPLHPCPPLHSKPSAFLFAHFCSSGPQVCPLLVKGHWSIITVGTGTLVALNQLLSLHAAGQCPYLLTHRDVILASELWRGGYNTPCLCGSSIVSLHTT